MSEISEDLSQTGLPTLNAADPSAKGYFAP